MSEVLNVAGLHVHYGMIEAVKGIDLTLVQGHITALLGANGAGKSTTLLALSGLVKASAGSIILEGVKITNQPTHTIVGSGALSSDWTMEWVAVRSPPGVSMVISAAA